MKTMVKYFMPSAVTTRAMPASVKCGLRMFSRWGGLSHNGRAHRFAIDPGRIGLANLRSVVDLTLELARYELCDERYAGVAILHR